MSRVDWANLASNVYQNKQLAKQTAQGEVMMEQMAQQAAMQRMQQMRHQNIVEKRKMVVKLDGISERAVGVSEQFPEYSLMMTEMSLELIKDAGLREDDFEEIGDMKSAGGMNRAMESAKSTIKGSMSDEQVSDTAKMKQFLITEEDEMESLEQYCSMNEEWQGGISEDYATIAPLHKKQNIMFLALRIGLFFAGMAMVGESDVDSDMSDIGLVLFLVGGAMLYYKWPKSMYTEQFEALDGMREAVEGANQRYQELSSKYGTSSSKEIGERRSQLMKWVEELTPDDESMLLNL